MNFVFCRLDPAFKNQRDTQLGQPTPTTNNLCGLLTSSQRKKENVKVYCVASGGFEPGFATLSKAPTLSLSTLPASHKRLLFATNKKTILAQTYCKSLTTPGQIKKLGQNRLTNHNCNNVSETQKYHTNFQLAIYLPWLPPASCKKNASKKLPFAPWSQNGLGQKIDAYAEEVALGQEKVRLIYRRHSTK